MTRSTIGILQTGVPPVDLAARHGRYDGMVGRMLGDGFATRTYDVAAGEWPERPEDHPAYVITGSPAGVYDPLPWIAALQGFIRVAHGRARLVGLCFGHQVMAVALGGQVVKSEKGWGLGLHDYDVVARTPWMEDDVRRVAVAASHQDQVIAPPDGATVFASSAFTPFAGLAYAGGHAISVQFHPEFAHDFAASLVERQRPLLAPGAADRALASLQAAGDAPRVAGWIRRFVEGAADPIDPAASFKQDRHPAP